MEGLYNSTSIRWQSLFVACLCILLFILLFSSIKKEKGIVLQSSNYASNPPRFFRYHCHEQPVFRCNDGISLYHYRF